MWETLNFKTWKKENKNKTNTSLFLKAKMIAPACSAAFPTIGSTMMLIKLTDIPHEVDASYYESKLLFC